MIYLLILSILVFTVYVTVITAKYGVLNSISESYYKLPYNSKFLFTLFCWGFSIPLMMVGLEQTGSILMFFAPAGIAFVGAAAAFKGDKVTHDVHMAGATIGIILSWLASMVLYDQYIAGVVFAFISATLVALTFALRKNLHYFWWIEILAYVFLLRAIIIRFVETIVWSII